MRKHQEKKIISDFADGYTEQLAHSFDIYNEHKGQPHNKEAFDKITGEYIKINRRRRLKKLLPLSASILTVILTLSCAKPIADFVINTYEKYTSIRYLSNFNDDYEISNVTITYIPENYVLTDTVTTENTLFNVYANEKADDFLTVEISKSSAINQNIDTENAEYTEYELYGFPAYMSAKDGRVILLVFVGGTSITITGDISADEAEKIVSGIRID